MIARFKLFTIAALGVALASGTAATASAKTIATHRAAVHADAKTPAKSGRFSTARAHHIGKTHLVGKTHRATASARIPSDRRAQPRQARRDQPHRVARQGEAGRQASDPEAGSPLRRQGQRRSLITPIVRGAHASRTILRRVRFPAWLRHASSRMTP